MKEMNSLKKCVGNIYNKVDNNKRLLLLKMVIFNNIGQRRRPIFEECSSCPQNKLLYCQNNPKSF
jgi:hypothetical protein